MADNSNVNVNGNTSKDLLLSSINCFYKGNEKYKLILKDIIEGKHELSLRMIDWLVTRYAKNNNIIYWINDVDDKIYHNLPDNYSSEKYKKITLYLDYRAQLKSFKKFNFDAFRRHERITFNITEKEEIETTVGQLNFFKWAFNNKIITYAIENQKKIYENMSKFSYKKQNSIKNSLIPKQDIINTKCFIVFD
jgi:hypothetical protein